MTSSQLFRLDMAERRQRAENGGIADQDVEPAVALVQRRAEPGDAVDSRVRSSGTSVAVPPAALICVVEFFQAADGARDGHHMRAGLRQRSAVAAPMPREAPVTSAMRLARGLVMMSVICRRHARTCAGHPVPHCLAFKDVYGRDPEHAAWRQDEDESARFGQQRQLPRRGSARCGR